ncbi:unnamed protein product [Mytilus coruscus]|uniref:Reverse transcriptase domain-containing protein n=1 Tax=Mytilus coruscus TaxID=42192 RepID=A0A6J8EVE7_MYTCO|nr:unnamed protein product [Mytilus coruscus]
MYEGDICYSNGMDGRQGVAVLASNYYKDKIKCTYKDDQGRFIHVTYYENDTLVNFISFYAPNVVSDRCNFYDFVIDYTKDLDNLIIGGDFNTSLSVLDRGSKTCHINDEPYRKLTKLMDDNNLYDIWRAGNPDCRIFSWKRISDGKLQQSRTNYFLVSRNMSSFVHSLYYNVTSMSDHSFVIMNFNCTCIERGPGLWVLNNTFLFNEEYVQRVKDIISQEKEKKYKQESNAIKELLNDNGDTVSGTGSILELQHSFFSDLYSCVTNDENKMSELLNFVTKTVNDDDNNMCNDDVTEDELSRIMSNRLKSVLPKIISEDQTCCIIGRDISNNISNVRDIMELVERDDLEGYFLKLDQANAFDRVSYTYLLAVLKKFGFGDRFVKLISIFYNAINSAVKCNGFLTKYFVIKNEPLHCKIVQNVNIKGINIPNSNKIGLIYQHADDNKESIPEVFKEFDLYTKATGARINRQKSEILYSDHAIVEMIQVVYENVNVQYIVDRYRNLLNVIPVEWKNTVNTDIHRISIPRTIDISIICKNVHYDLKLYSTKTLYTIMLENIVEQPVGIELWKSEFDVSSEAFSKIWEHINMYWKPSNLVELDFKVLHNCIFTNVKLQKIGLVDDNICKVCCSEKEDILHIFMNCDQLQDFHNYLSSLLVRIIENCNSDKISLVRSEELLILGLRWHMKGVNDTFLNFFMSVARYCIFRRRNLLNSGYSNGAGHLARACQTAPCSKCKHFLSYCKCEPVWGRSTRDDDGAKDVNGRTESSNDTEQADGETNVTEEANDEEKDDDNMQQDDQDDQDDRADVENKDDDDTLCSDTNIDNSADVDQIQTDTVHDDDDLDSVLIDC